MGGKDDDGVQRERAVPSRFTLQCDSPAPLRPALHSELAEKAAKLQFSACGIFSVIEILQNGINLSHSKGWKVNIGENDALLQELYRKAADRA
ncbi:hypothetical protein L3476_18015 [Paenibacillus thiaminolyticus]|uniref:hypothetical protein n=1 Tax=Paenibacillus thiaminolyticus TaxID=49283 RepID=UPI002350FACE|nr:hypothetical protein [Paenibacillus thiaminolyticus]WCR25246.1 hypothetical protein L3476_18015 [Paenibacillus thiaminolyticus]